MASSAAVDPLNEAAVNPKRLDVHTAIASRMGQGQGGLYRHLYGSDQPLDGRRAVWLTRPRGIRYEPALLEMVDRATGFLSCWRRQMVLGPADEFVIVGTAQLEMSTMRGWQARTVERTVLPRRDGHRGEEPK